MKLFLVVSYLEFQDIKTTQELPRNKKITIKTDPARHLYEYYFDDVRL